MKRIVVLSALVVVISLPSAYAGQTAEVGTAGIGVNGGLVNDYVFILAGGIPPFEFLKGMGVEFGGEIRRKSEPAATASSK
ncbi:MAG: hypothetical protein ABIJ61_01935 [bacterium]